MKITNKVYSVERVLNVTNIPDKIVEKMKGKIWENIVQNAITHANFTKRTKPQDKRIAKRNNKVFKSVGHPTERLRDKKKVNYLADANLIHEPYVWSRSNPKQTLIDKVPSDEEILDTVKSMRFA